MPQVGPGLSEYGLSDSRIMESPTEIALFPLQFQSAQLIQG